MGICDLLWRRLCRPLIMSQAEARAFSARKSKAPRETLRHIKNKEKLSRTGTLGPHTFYVQTVASGSRDTGASLYLFSEHNRFGPRTEHLILNESVSSIHNQSAYRIQTQLNLIHPRIFPPLPDLSRKETAEKDVRGVKAECLLKYQLRPTREWQRDMVTSNNGPEFVKEAMKLPGFPDALKLCRRLLEADLQQSAVCLPVYFGLS
ncbi:zinc phosphodiesterase ELAC protein 2-like isoform X4 [Aquarana catesbeiana]|uniref:zinc phosphodiesterase ELAC protein 2-like isoform X4 n=1 Tax=Aquarana catesbeiana TaxID=8400 RepID=UPI003CC9B089